MTFIVAPESVSVHLMPCRINDFTESTCYQWLEAYKYIRAIDASHLRCAHCKI